MLLVPVSGEMPVMTGGGGAIFNVPKLTVGSARLTEPLPA